MTQPQMTTLDLTGRTTTKVNLKIDRETRDNIEDMLRRRELARREAAREDPAAPLPDFTPQVPREIVLHLREVNLHAQRRWAAERDTEGVTDPVRWTAKLMRARAAEDIDIDVLIEVVMGMSDSVMAQMQQAYVSGVIFDPKALATATTAVKVRMGEETLLQLGEALRSSPLTTASDPGNATN